MTHNPSGPSGRDARIQALVGVIRAAEAELGQLTGGHIDALALGNDAGYLLLPDGQRQLLEREAAQRAAASELQSTLDAVPAHIALLDKEAVIVAVNEAWRRFGDANGQADGSIGVNYLDICDRATGECSEEAQLASDGIRRVLRREAELFTLEYPCHAPDQRRWFRLMVTPVLTQRGGAVVTHVDVTARRLAEDAVRASEARLKETQRIAGLGSWDLDLASGHLSWVGEVAQLFGIEPAAPPGTLDAFLACVHPDDRAGVETALRRVSDGDALLETEHRIVHPNGEVRFVRERGEVIHDEQGQPVVLAGSMLDITDLRLSQHHVATASAFLLEAQRIARLGSWDFDVASRRLTWSDETCRIFGTTLEEFPGTFDAFAAFLLPEDRGALDLAHAGVHPGAPNLEAEFRIRRADGEVRWLYERGVVVFDEGGRSVRRLGVVMDITERRMAEEALRASEERFRATFTAAAAGMALAATADGRFLDCNDAYCRMVGYSRDELRAMDFPSLTHPDDRGRNIELLGELLAGRRTSFIIEKRYLAKGGRTVWTRVSVAAMPDASGTPTSVIAVAEDITDLKAAETQRDEFLAREQIARREADSASRYYQSLFECAPGAYLVLRADDYTITGVSEAYLRATMTTRGEIQGRHIFDVFPDRPDEAGSQPTSMLRASLDRVKDLGRSDVMAVQRYPIRRPAEDGGGWEDRYWSPVNTPVPGPDGRVAFIIYRVEDVTDYVMAHQTAQGVSDAHRVLETRTQQVEADILLRNQEIKKANDELIRSQSLLRMAGNAARLGGWRLELTPDRLVWSDETCAIHDRPPGYQPTLAEALEYYLPEYREMVSAALQRTMDTGAPFEFEAELTTAKGRRLWVRAIGELVRNDAGGAVGLQGAVQDITTQVESATEVERLARRLTTTLESLTDAFFTLDSAWCFSYVNAQTEVLLRQPRHELMGRNVWDLFPEAVGGQFHREYERAVRDRVAVTFDEYYAPLDAWFEVRAYPSEEGLAVYFRDVTERRRQRGALLASEERFRLLSKATNDAIWDWDLASNALWWNEGFEVLFGFSRDEVESSIASWTTRIHPADQGRIVAGIQAAIDSGATGWSSEYRFLRKDGSYAYVLDRGHVIRDETGRAIRMIGGMTDLTERRATEERLREQATLLDKAQDAIIVRDLDHRITYWNQSAERMYGWSAGDAIGQSVVDLVYRVPTHFLAATAMTLEHGEWVGELQQQTKLGQLITVEARWTLVRDDAGAPKSILSINTDITERKTLELQFLRAQRMESIGTLAGGIAHDLNNVLAPIMMSIDLLQLAYPDDEAREILDTIQTSAKRGAEMVSQVLSFARGMDGQRVAVRAAYLIADLEKIVKDTFPKNITVEVAVAPDLWVLEADPTQLHQVLLNLCVNARDAMPDGGQITIRAENMVIDDHYAAMNVEARVGPHVRIEVEDTGVGIPPAIVERVFEPFFTTKDIGKGTGLGLSTTLAIVKSHGGFIRAYSEPGTGAKFRVYLPSAATLAHTDVPVDPVHPRGNGETVLVVDDEASIRQITRQTLETFGYRVQVAANGADAVALFAQRAGDIAVVLVDMMMPLMDGPATIRALRQIAPSVRIIGASGITGNGKVAQAAGVGVKDFLPKPYTAETLLKAIDRCLTG